MSPISFPITTVPGGICSITFSNLSAFQDRSFAVVAVDATGAFDSVVDYSAAYVLAPTGRIPPVLDLRRR